MPDVLTVSSFARYARECIEDAFGDVKVEGEISNFKQHFIEIELIYFLLLSPQKMFIDIVRYTMLLYLHILSYFIYLYYLRNIIHIIILYDVLSFTCEH